MTCDTRSISQNAAGRCAVLLCLLAFPCAAGVGSEPGRAAASTAPAPVRAPIAAVDTPAGATTYLDQGWTPDQRLAFYTTSQGSQLVPYRWFLALEQPGSQGKLRADANIERLCYLPQAPSEANPDGLPVGFVKDKETDWLGLTCAACHTTQVNYQGAAIRIDGGPSLGDVAGLLTSLADALRQTFEDPPKFEHFAAEVLGSVNTAGERQILKAQMEYVLELRDGYNQRNMPAQPAFGFGRVDALGAILNEVLVRFLEIPANQKPANAPVSYPFLWDTPQHDFVQWNGSAQNGHFGSLGRNVGEVLGVFANLQIPDPPNIFGYPSTARIGGLIELERLLERLESPLWPPEFPAIDATKLAAGAELYQEYCVRCHHPIQRDDPHRRVFAQMVATGTDPATADNFSRRTASTGRLAGTHKNPLKLFGERFEATASGEEILINEVIGAIIHSPFSPPKDELVRIREEFEQNRVNAALLEDVPVELGPKYKGRPLNGIWATAPYLHNGSVPNLNEILLPADQRSKSFYVGNREFDPQKVGFRAEPFPSGFEFRTEDTMGRPIPGNSNQGHEYGTGRARAEGGDDKPALTDQERATLLEYLKSL